MNPYMHPLGALSPLKRDEKKTEQSAPFMRPPVMAPLPSEGALLRNAAVVSAPEHGTPEACAESTAGGYSTAEADTVYETPEEIRKEKATEAASAEFVNVSTEKMNDMPLSPLLKAEPAAAEPLIPEEISARPDAIDTEIMPEPYTIPLMESMAGKYRGKRREDK